MAKYLKLFMVALFATMSFALTSCGDDDDDDDVSFGNAKGELTVDGTKYSFDIFIGDLHEGEGCYDYSCLLYSAKTDDYSLLITINDWDEVYQGLVWDRNNSSAFDSDCYLTVTWSTTSAKIGGGPVSGTAKVTELDKKAKKITLSFNNAAFEYYSGSYENFPTFTINGTITLPID